MPFTKYSAKQKKLAAVAGDPKKIEAVDLKTLARKRMKKEQKKWTYGKGSYGSKTGRPSKAAKKDPKLKKAAMKKMMAARRK